MRKHLLLLLTHDFALASLVQVGDPVNPQKDKLEFDGYTIRLLPAMGGTYGYEIIKGKGSGPTTVTQTAATSESLRLRYRQARHRH